MTISTRTPPPVPSRWAESEAAKKRKRRRTRRIVFYVLASVIAAVLMGIGIWELVGAYKVHKHQQLLDALHKDPTQIQAAIDSHQITDREGMHLQFQNMAEDHQKQIDEYFALKSVAERAAWMKAYILAQPERDAERHKNWVAMMGATTRPAGGGNNEKANANAQNQANRAAHQVAFHESRSPNQTSQYQQFRADLAAAYKQMGQQPPQGRGGRGGGR